CKYATEILERAGMVSCNSSRAPVDTESNLGDDGDPVSDPTLYQSLAGSLQYLTFTFPDICYAVQQVCLYMHDPRESHFSALKRVLSPSSAQLMLSRSSAEAEYRGVANVVAETYLVAAGQVRVLHVPSRYQYVDIFTKDLPFALFEEFRTSLSVRCPLAQTAKEC
ncbi:ribonuclease H-like domain-containing protein, partial [Tanacetum coccineum]